MKLPSLSVHNVLIATGAGCTALAAVFATGGTDDPSFLISGVATAVLAAIKAYKHEIDQ